MTIAAFNGLDLIAALAAGGTGGSGGVVPLAVEIVNAAPVSSATVNTWTTFATLPTFTPAFTQEVPVSASFEWHVGVLTPSVLFRIVDGSANIWAQWAAYNGTSFPAASESFWTNLVGARRVTGGTPVALSIQYYTSASAGNLAMQGVTADGSTINHFRAIYLTGGVAVLATDTVVELVNQAQGFTNAVVYTNIGAALSTFTPAFTQVVKISAEFAWETTGGSFPNGFRIVDELSNVIAEVPTATSSGGNVDLVPTYLAGEQLVTAGTAKTYHLQAFTNAGSLTTFLSAYTNFFRATYVSGAYPVPKWYVVNKPTSGVSIDGSPVSTGGISLTSASPPATIYSDSFTTTVPNQKVNLLIRVLLIGNTAPFVYIDTPPPSLAPNMPFQPCSVFSPPINPGTGTSGATMVLALEATIATPGTYPIRVRAASSDNSGAAYVNLVLQSPDPIL